jgi:hypothetical protein
MSELAKKLRMQAGQKVLILNEPEGYRELLGELPDGVEEGKEPQEQGYDFVHLFVRNVAELEEWAPKALRSVKFDALLWISYPKKSGKIKTDISRDQGWNLVTAAGFDGVMQVSIDETWSALRFRPAEVIGASRERRTAGSAAPVGRTHREVKELEVPEDLVAALAGQEEARAVFEKLAPSHKREYVEWIVSAKREETRKGRIEKAVEKLAKGLKRPSMKE